MSNTNLSTIMRNRRELRARGVTAGALHILEAIARQAPEGLVRLSVAALGRIAGIGRSTALRHVQRLEELGMVVRIGPAIMVNAKTMLKVAADAVKNRAAHLKRLFLKRESKSVRTRQQHRTRTLLLDHDSAQIGETMARADAMRQLRETYIPPYLRKNR